MPTSASAADLIALRMWSQRITEPATGSVADTVSYMLALQAQDFASALWAVGIRTAGSRRGDVIAALESGEVVRSMPMRGTLHFLAAEDLGWMLGLTAQRALNAAAARRRNLGIDEASIAAAVDVTTRVLAGTALGRAEYLEALSSAGIDVEQQRGYHYIFHLSQLGLVCWGPPSGTQQALVLSEEWIRSPRTLDRDESLRELGLRFFTSHGPATIRDLSWWTKLTLTDARTAAAAAGNELLELEHDGTTYFASAREVDSAPARPGPAVHALPGFDEYLLGYQDRSLQLDAEHFERIVPGQNGIFLPMIVAGGRIRGTWRRAAKGDGIEADWFEHPSAAQVAALEKSASRRRTFLD